MDCQNCPLSKFTMVDKGVSIRRQEEMRHQLRFVLSHPMPSFVDPVIFPCPTSMIFDRFVKAPHDLVFTKNCLQANRIEDAKGKTALERSARACCSSTLRSDLTGAKVIVCCGNEALAALGYDRKAGDAVGWVDYNEELGASVLACLDPHQVEANPDALAKDWIWTVQRAQEILLGFAPDRNITPDPEWVRAESVEHFKELTGVYPDGEFMIIDIEGTGLNFREDRILQIGLYHPSQKPVIIMPEVFQDQDFVEAFMELCERMLVTPHNGKFDGKFIDKELGINMPIDYDTLLLHHFIDERSGVHGLKRLISLYLNWGEYDKEIHKYYKMEGGLANAPEDEVSDYLSLDLVGTWQVLHKELDYLRDDRQNTKYPWKIQLSQRDHVEKIINPVNNELKRIEAEGFLVDEARLDELIGEAEPSVAAKKKDIEDYLFNELGQEVSVDSPVQLLKALHELGALRKEIDTTEAKVLKDYISVPIIKDLLDYKKESKVLNAFYRSIKNKLVVTKWGKKVFATFNLAGTIGSRWSGANPNLQQAPRAPHPFKSIFIPNRGRIIFQNDFSALEVCVAAYLSRDEALAEGFKKDLHTTVSKAAFVKYFDEMAEIESVEKMHDFLSKHSLMTAVRKSLEKAEQKEGAYTLPQLKDAVTKHLRYCAKVVTFGIFYGRGAKALAEQELSCSISDAQAFIDNYFKLFPGLHKFIKKVHYLVKDVGIIIAPDGRVRDLRSWMFSADEMSRKRSYARAIRQAVNFLTQNYSGTINNIAFMKAANYIKAHECGEVKLAIHDSTVGEVDFNPEAEAHLDNIVAEQESILEDDLVRLGVDCEAGFNLGELYPKAVFFGGVGPVALKLGLDVLSPAEMTKRLTIFWRKVKIEKMTDEERLKERIDPEEISRLEARIAEIDAEWEKLLEPAKVH